MVLVAACQFRANRDLGSYEQIDRAMRTRSRAAAVLNRLEQAWSRRDTEPGDIDRFLTRVSKTYLHFAFAQLCLRLDDHAHFKLWSKQMRESAFAAIESAKTCPKHLAEHPRLLLWTGMAKYPIGTGLFWEGKYHEAWSAIHLARVDLQRVPDDTGYTEATFLFADVAIRFLNPLSTQSPDTWPATRERVLEIARLSLEGCDWFLATKSRVAGKESVERMNQLKGQLEAIEKRLELATKR